MYSKFLMTVAMLAVAICGASCAVLMAEESDAETYSYYRGDSVNDLLVGVGSSVSGSVPGITFASEIRAGQYYIIASGTFTSTGTYTITRLNPDSSIAGTTTFNISEPSATFTVTIRTTSGGSVNASSLTVASGTTFTSSHNTMTIGSNHLVATANSGYYFAGWTPSSGTVTSNMTIFAQFAEYVTYYTIQILPHNSAGGAISPSGSISVASGTSFSSSGDRLTIGGNVFTATANAGYAFDHWSETTGTITGDKTLYAYFYAQTLTASVRAGTNGTAYIENVTAGTTSTVAAAGQTVTLTVNAGDSLNYYATGSEGYVFADWRANNVIMTTDNPMSVSVSTTLESATMVTYYCTFETAPAGSITVTVLPHNSAGGAISPSGSISVASGTSFSSSGDRLTIGGNVFTATANAGYAFDHWSETTGTITGDKTLYAYFYAQTLTASVRAGTNGTAYIENVTAGTTSTVAAAGQTVTLTVNAGDSLNYYAAPDYGYDLTGWFVTNNHQFITYDNPMNMTVSTTMENAANFLAYLCEFTPTGQTPSFITFQGSPVEGGTINQTEITAFVGDAWLITGNTIAFRVHGSAFVTVTATPAEGYTFSRWSVADNGTVEGDMNILAYFSDGSDSYWTNDNYNGKIDLIFSFEGNGSQEITGDLFTGSSSAGVANWSFTGLTVKTFVQKSASQTRVGAQLLQGSEVIKSNAVSGSWPNVGSWDALQVSIDPENAQVTFIPVSVLNSFTDYKLYTTQARTMLSWGEVLESSAIRTLQHEASGDAPRFSVVNTRVFLDTYNAVLFDPRINVREKFPQYDSVRLNFYSFALYGDSMTVNGYTYPVVGDKITITYVDKDGTHYAVGAVEGGEQRTRDFTLSNIYVSWDALTGHCTLTFVGDRWTMDLGEYSNQIVSFAGMWYFYTMLYNSHITQEKGLGDWKALPETNQSQMVLIYLGILAVAGVAGIIHLRHGGHATLDLIVIGCAGLVGYILLG